VNDVERRAKIESILYVVYGNQQIIPIIADRLNKLYHFTVVEGGQDFPTNEFVRVIWTNLPGGRKAALAAEKLRDALD